jgi:4'-phosphopantetheinyl transferase EntD
MMEALIPPPACSADKFLRSAAAASELYPREAATVARAVPKRRQEYASVRVCARRAMRELGVAPTPLPPGRRGAPRWPSGLVGSMTHCPGYQAAVIGHARDFRGFGIDAEPNLPLPRSLMKIVALPQERLLVRALAEVSHQVCWDRLVFSAKEAVFKVWYPLTGRELDFRSAEIGIDSALGTFIARLAMPDIGADSALLKTLHGRWMCRNGIVATAITLANPA